MPLSVRISSILEQILVNVENVAVCHNIIKSCAEFLSLFRDLVNRNINIPNNVNQRTIEKNIGVITASLEDFNRILLLISKGTWNILGPRMNMQDLFQDIQETMIKVENSMLGLHLKSPHFDLPNNNIILDLVFLYSQLISSKQTKICVKVAKESIELMFQQYHSKIPKEIEIQEEPFPKLMEYEFDLSNINAPTKLPVISSATGGIYQTTYSLDPNQNIYVKILDIDYSDQLTLKRTKYESIFLASLKHQTLLKYFGASNHTDQVAYVFEYIPGPPLSTLLHQGNIIHKQDITRIAYYIARGLCYLHSKNVIHGSISTNTIFIDNEKSPKMADISITPMNIKPNDQSIKLMPPEYLLSNVYTKQSDIYCFGMLMYELLTRDIPFKTEQINTIKSEIIKKKKRPILPDNISPTLQALFRDCWEENPKNRPSFFQIVRRFENGEIIFPCSHPGMIEEYFAGIRLAKMNPESLSSPDIHKILDAFDNPDNDELLVLLKRLITKKEQASLIPELVDHGLIGRLTSILIKVRKTQEFGNILSFFLKDGKNVESFLEANGTYVLVQLLKSDEKYEVAINLVKLIIPYIPSQNAINLFQPLLNRKNLDLAHQTYLACQNSKAKLLIEDYLPQIFENPCDDGIFFINEFLTIPGASTKVTTDQIIQFGSPIVTNSYIATCPLISIKDIFKGLDPKNSDSTQICAYILALKLDERVFEVFRRFPQIISCAMNISDKNLAYKFIIRMCQFPEISELIVKNYSDLLTNSFNDPWLLTLLSRIASFFPSKVLQLTDFKQKIKQCLNNSSLIEPTLRLLGVLSNEESLWEDESIIEKLFDLREYNDLNVIESQLFFALISNNAKVEQIQKKYRYFLGIAESNGIYSGLALRILAKCDIAIIPKKDINRLVKILLISLQKDDLYALYSSAEIIKNLCVSSYKNSLSQFPVASYLIKAIRNQSDPYVFVALIHALNELGIVIPSQILSLYDIIMSKASSNLRNETSELRTCICAKIY